MGCPILLPFFLGNIQPHPATTDIIQGQPLQWLQFAPKCLVSQSWSISLERALGLESSLWGNLNFWSQLHGQTVMWPSGINHNDSPTRFHYFVPYQVLGIISTAFSALHTLSLIPQQPWCLLINLHPVTSLSGPKLPDTCQEPHTSKRTLTDTHTDSVSCISGSSAAPTVSLIFQFSGVCIHLGAALELFHLSSWSQADLSSFPVHPEEGKGWFSSE